MQEIRITGEKVVLRPMGYEDTDLIVKWRNNERVRGNFIYRETFTAKGHENWIKTMVATGRVVQFIICEKKDMRPVGSVYFRDIDRIKKEAEYGIFLGEDDAAGKGYGTETARLACDYAFEKMGLKKLVLRVFTDNEAAVKSYRNAGFAEESLLKDVVCSDGEKKDMLFMSKGKETLVSFVIPCYRSELTLPKVVKEIRESVQNLRQQGKNYDYEIILVNDCSPDDTFSVIKDFCMEDRKIKGVNLSKNFGQGIEKGSDVVYAKYEHKKHSVFRNFGSKVNEEMARIMLGKPKNLYVSSYFAAKRFVVEEMKKYTNAYPYVIGLVLRTTKRISNVTVCHREREIGTSGYTFGKLIGLWFNGFTAFSVKPLRLATLVGCACSAMGFIYGIYTVIKKLVNPNVPMGFSSLMAAIVFLGGMTMVMLGLVGEYIGRMYISMNNAPQFVIRETINDEE